MTADAALGGRHVAGAAAAWEQGAGCLGLAGTPPPGRRRRLERPRTGRQAPTPSRPGGERPTPRGRRRRRHLDRGRRGVRSRRGRPRTPTPPDAHDRTATGTSTWRRPGSIAALRRTPPTATRASTSPSTLRQRHRRSGRAMVRSARVAVARRAASWRLDGAVPIESGDGRTDRRHGGGEPGRRRRRRLRASNPTRPAPGSSTRAPSTSTARSWRARCRSPARARPASRSSYAVTAPDAWSPISSVVWSFGDGGTASGARCEAHLRGSRHLQRLGHRHRRRRQRDVRGPAPRSSPRPRCRQRRQCRRSSRP